MDVLNSKPLNAARFAEPVTLRLLAYASAQASSDGRVIPARRVQAAGRAIARAEAPSFEPDVYIMPPMRPMYARALANVKPSGVTKIRARVIWGRGAAVGRSFSRALPMTKLMSGQAFATSDASLDGGKVARIRFPRLEQAEAKASATASGYVVRHMSASVAGESEHRFAPTIIHEGARYSYFSGVAPAESTATASAHRIRYGTPEEVAAEADATVQSRVYRRMSPVRMTGEASALADESGLYIAHWHYGRARIESEAACHAEPLVSRRGGGRAVATAVANSVQPTVIRRVFSQAIAESNAWAECWALRAFAGKAEAESSALAISKVYRPAAATVEATATSHVTPLRLARPVIEPIVGEAYLPLVRPITNDATPPPLSRQMTVYGQSREFVVPAQNREYLVT